MLNIIAIFIGGGFGAISRYGVANLLRNYSIDFPFATLIVNIVGSLILGLVAALFWKEVQISPVWHNTLRLAITIGFCGGLTTFSTFSWETFDLIKNGEFTLAIIYALISMLTCLLAISFGAFLSRYV